MIVEWFASLGVTVATFVLSWFDGIEVPTWLDDFAGIIAQVIAGGAGMGAWIPWALLWSVLAAVFALWLIGFTVKGVRWLVGWLPTMGGA